MPEATRRARNVMQAVIFSEILKPLGAGLGPVGETVIGSVAERLFVRTRP